MLTKNLTDSKHNFFITHGNNYPDYQSFILSIVESQVIPRLLKVERIKKSKLSLTPAARALPTQKEIELFVDLCISKDQKVSQAFVDHFLKTGWRKEDILLELIAPAARYLGSQWDDDRMDFSQVNLGFVRLHAITNAFRFASKESLSVQGKVNRVIIATAPGSLHMLGATIVADFFRQKGWQVEVAISSSSNELVQTVSNEWFDVIGLSISIEQQLTNLADLIRQFKSSSLNPRAAILLGGPIFTAKKFRAMDFGADGICVDAKHAVSLAASLLPKEQIQPDRDALKLP
jgi:methanogenic corrinoid protein MtbC1